MSRIKEMAIVGGAGACVVAVIAATFVMGGGSDKAQPSSNDASAFHNAVLDNTGPVVIDPTIKETFTPATQAEVDANEGKVISSRDAFNTYIQADTWSLPKDATVTEGYLTLPLGAGAPGEYTAKDQLVYAYRWHQCGPVSTPVQPPDGKASPTEAATPTPACTSWTFLDATTGELIDRTWSE